MRHRSRILALPLIVFSIHGQDTKKKPSIGDIKAGVDKVFDSQADAAAQAQRSQKQAEASRVQAAVNAALDAYKQRQSEESRFQTLESGLKGVEDAKKAETDKAEADRAAAAQAAKADHVDTMRALRTATIGAFGTIFGALALMGIKTVADRRSRNREQAQLGKIHEGVTQIHAFVNSQKTEEIRSELLAHQASLAAFHALVVVLKSHGEEIPAETLAAIKAGESQTAILSMRLKAQEDATEVANRI